MAELIYYCGTMDAGKSTLALQTAHNHESRGRSGVIFTSNDRAGVGVLSSRLGLQKPAVEVTTE
ncbi:MAG: thymidine kinase, partial [Actinomycetes bacterium]